jgi:hypothetical protein
MVPARRGSAVLCEGTGCDYQVTRPAHDRSFTGPYTETAR